MVLFKGTVIGRDCDVDRCLCWLRLTGWWYVAIFTVCLLHFYHVFTHNTRFISLQMIVNVIGASDVRSDVFVLCLTPDCSFIHGPKLIWKRWETLVCVYSIESISIVWHINADFYYGVRHLLHIQVFVVAKSEMHYRQTVFIKLLWHGKQVTKIINGYFCKWCQAEGRRTNVLKSREHPLFSSSQTSVH